MLEVEVRYRTTDRAGVVARLREWNAKLVADRPTSISTQPARTRPQGPDEAFRLRRIGQMNFLTYKGPKRDAETKTRTEIEVPLGDGDEVAADMERMLAALGYRPVVVVRKRRQVFGFRRDEFQMEVCFDHVELVGPFVELEILAPDDEYERAKAVLLETAAELGLTEKESRSYLGMVLEAKSKRS